MAEKNEECECEMCQVSDAYIEFLKGLEPEANNEHL